MLNLDTAERVLAALGEVSRLRLTLLCLAGEHGVGELARALDQSEPRVSRHLKILAEAGLVERRREGHRVLYRAVARGDSAEIARVALACIDPNDPTLRRDQLRAARPRTRRSDLPLPAESRLGRALADWVRRHSAPAGGVAAGGVALLGLQHLELLDALCRLGAEPTAVAASAAAADVARSWAVRRALECQVVTGRLPAGIRVEGLLLDRSAGAVGALEPALAEARERLLPGGRLWLFERYEALEDAGARVVEHPLAKLRRVLGEHGLSCERIQPLESDGVHVLATTASAAAARIDAA